jgi:hypothetical protein
LKKNAAATGHHNTMQANQKVGFHKKLGDLSANFKPAVSHKPHLCPAMRRAFFWNFFSHK